MSVFDPYVVFYEVRSYGVRVLRIIHGARDLGQAWREDDPSDIS